MKTETPNNRKTLYVLPPAWVFTLAGLGTTAGIVCAILLMHCMAA